MTIVYTIQHPAHVHLFRNSIEVLSETGHDVRVFAREKDVNVDLLEHYGIGHEVLATEPTRSWELPLVQAKYEAGVIRAARRLDADVLVAVGEPAVAHASAVCDARSLLLTDTEHATLQNALAFPFADRILTPSCYRDEIGSKQERYPGYHELAYLHPNRFTPDPSILADAGIDPDDRFVVLRLVSWDAAHDVGDSGFEDVTDVIARLESTGVRVLITAESELPDAVEERRISVDPHHIHHVLSSADLFIGESATMATESAVLGTPAIFVSTSRRGYTDELEAEFDLVYNFSGPRRQHNALSRALSILDAYDPSTWERRRQRMLDEKIDTTDFLVRQIESEVGHG